MENTSRAGGGESSDALAWVRAAGEGVPARVAFWLAAGTDVNAALENGETALIRAASQGHHEVVRLLLEAGADPDAEREDGFTALGVAVFFGHAEVVRALLAGGADPTGKGRLGAAVEQWALGSGHDEIAELLRSHKSSGAQGRGGSAAAGAGTAGGPELFPAEGKFSPVVPLSTIAEPPDSGAAGAAGGGVGEGGEPKDVEVMTVVRPRVSPTPASRAARGGRPTTLRPPWSFNLLVICLSVFAGIVAGTYLMRAIGAARLAQQAPPVEGSEAADSAPEPRPAGPTADSRQPLSTVSLPEPLPTAAPPETAPAAPVVAAEAGPKAEGADEAETPTRRSQDAPSKSRRAASAEPASPGKATATVRAARPSARAAGERTIEARRDSPAADPGANSTGARLILASPRAVPPPPPVVSPAPSNKSERRKVVPWP